MGFFKRLFSNKIDTERPHLDDNVMDNADAYHERGSSKVKSGNTNGAIVDFTKAIKLNPSHPLAYGSRGWVYAVSGKYSKAIQDLTKDIELNPNVALTYFYLAECRRLSKGSDLIKTIQDYSKAIELDPNYAEAYLQRAKTYGFLGLISKDKGDFAKAMSDYERFLLLAPNHPEVPMCQKVMDMLEKDKGVKRSQQIEKN